MKKVLFSILFAGAATLAHAQKSEVADAKKEWGLFQITMNQKPSLEKTLAALNSGLKHTDNAIANEKSKNMPEAWSYRALFASAIAASDTTNFENSSAKQKIAEEAVAKAKELDTKGDEKANISTAEINISNAIKLRAFTAYNKKDYAGALKYFNEATEKNPSDTSIELKDTVGGIALLKEASAKFPDAEGFIQTETQLYINKGDIVKSEEMLNKLVAKDPKNPTYQYLMDKALPYYLKSSELDPKYAPALEALKRVYAFKNDTPKYEAVKKKLEALKP
eukprot:gene15382-18585_t